LGLKYLLIINPYYVTDIQILFLELYDTKFESSLWFTKQPVGYRYIKWVLSWNRSNNILNWKSEHRIECLKVLLLLVNK
jgi:hypothetical protein